MANLVPIRRCLIFAGKYDRSLGPKAVLFAVVFAALLVGVWVLFKDIDRLFVWNNPGGPAVHPAFLRRLILTSCLGIYFVRLAIAVFIFMRRRITWVEAGLVSGWLSFVLLIVAWVGSREFQAVGPVELVGVLLYLAGSYLNTSSEYTRYVWKNRNPERLYTGGLFTYAMHINYFGDVVLFAGLVMVTHQIALVFIPLLMAANFILFLIPSMDCYLGKKYGQEFVEYAGRTKRFIPLIY